jgi:hypothetical protein
VRASSCAQAVTERVGPTAGCSCAGHVSYALLDYMIRMSRLAGPALAAVRQARTQDLILLYISCNLLGYIVDMHIKRAQSG